MANPSRPPRWVVIDDVDPSIRFDGSGWFTTANPQESIGNYGPTYLSTLHGTNSDAQLSFTFNGSALRLWGSNVNNSRVGCHCFIDGVEVYSVEPGGPISPSSFAQNNLRFCDWADGTPEEHTLTVEATTRGQTFWVDKIEYIPSSSASLASASVISVDHMDRTIKFGEGWEALGVMANFTQRYGATVMVEFVGTKLSWWGFIPDVYGKAPSMATYAIDSGPVTGFVLRGLADDEQATYNEKYFETPLLSPGPHRLLVEYQGVSQEVPLTLTNLLIEVGNPTPPLPSDSSTLIPGPSSSSAPSSNAPAEGGNKAPIGAIVGGVVGGLAIITASIIITLLVLRLRKAKHKADKRRHIAPYDSFARTLPAHGGPPVGFTSNALPSLFLPTRKASSVGTNIPPFNLAASAPSARQAQTEILDARAQGSRPLNSTNEPRVVLHEDSGVRMDAETNTIELPPQYTAQ